MTATAIWHGTREEWADLWLAIGTVCTCEFDEMTGAERSVCASHALLEDQVALDHLLHIRRLRGLFIRHEWEQSDQHQPDPKALSEIHR